MKNHTFFIFQIPDEILGNISQPRATQGSILGPLLFLIIYINDLSNVSTVSHLVLFADDTNIFINAKAPDILQEAVNKELADIAKWLKANKLSLNIKKTQFMVFTRRKVIPTKIGIKIGDQCITETKISKFLGTYIDNNLNWKSHISYIAGKIARGVGSRLENTSVVNV